MQRPYLIGAGALSTDMATFSALDELHTEGKLDHIQVMLIPEDEPSFRDHLDRMSTTGATLFLHAPHHGQAVNPCAPHLFSKKREGDITRWIEHAMALTFEAADRLGAPAIVLHAGVYTKGDEPEAIRTFREFLDMYRDPRLIVENLPAVYKDLHLLGSTAEELVAICEGKIHGFCLDFAHLYCTANYLGHPFPEMLQKFDALPVKLSHLSNSEKGSITDQHLPLDHPNGGLNMREIVGFITRHPRVHTSLEFKDNDPAIYNGQLQVFDRIFQRWSREFI